MAAQNTFKQLLNQHLSVNQTNIPVPDVEKLYAARQLVLKRKDVVAPRPDVVSLTAAFLNMKIKLYHAVIASVLIAATILYLTKSNSAPQKESQISQYNQNIAAVNNSTVLSSINTFVIRK